MFKQCSLVTQPVRLQSRGVMRKTAVLLLLCGMVVACHKLPPEPGMLSLSLRVTCTDHAAVCPQNGESGINIPMTLTLSSSLGSRQLQYTPGPVSFADRQVVIDVQPIPLLVNDEHVDKVEVAAADEGRCDIGSGTTTMAPRDSQAALDLKTGPSRQCKLKLSANMLQQTFQTSAPQPVGVQPPAGMEPTWQVPVWQPMMDSSQAIQSLPKGTQIRLHTDWRGDDRQYFAGWSFKQMKPDGTPGDSAISLCRGSTTECIFTLNNSYQISSEQVTKLCDPTMQLCEEHPGIPLRALVSSSPSLDLWVSSENTSSSTLIYVVNKGLTYIPQVVRKDDSAALYGLWAKPEAQDVLAVGSNAMIATRSLTGEWTKDTNAQNAFGGTTLYAIYMNKDLSEGWAAGSGGVILHFENKSWKLQSTGTGVNPGTFYGIGQDQHKVSWAGGSGGMWKLDPGATAWKKQNDFKEISALWIDQQGTSGYAIDSNGSAFSIWQLTDTGWSRRSLHLPSDAGEVEIHSIMGVTPGRLFIAGQSRADANQPWRGFLGKVNIMNGEARCDRNYVANQLPLYSVFANATDLWASGDQGTLLHATGQSWQLQANSSTDDLRFETVPVQIVPPQ